MKFVDSVNLWLENVYTNLLVIGLSTIIVTLILCYLLYIIKPKLENKVY